MLITSITLNGDYGISTASYVYNVYTKPNGAYYKSILHRSYKSSYNEVFDYAKEYMKAEQVPMSHLEIQE